MPDRYLLQYRFLPFLASPCVSGPRLLPALLTADLAPRVPAKSRHLLLITGSVGSTTFSKTQNTAPMLEAVSSLPTLPR